MKKWIQLSLMLLLPTTLNAADKPLHLINTGEWTYVRVAPNSPLHMFTDGAEAVLVNNTISSDERPPVRIRKMPLKNVSHLRDAPASEWRKTLLGEKHEEISTAREKLIEKDGHVRYLLEFSSKRGKEQPLRSTLLATLVEGELYVLIFEDRDPVFKRQLASVRKLFKELTILNQVRPRG